MAYWGVNQQQMISVEVCILSEAFSLHTNVINTCICIIYIIYIYMYLYICIYIYMYFFLNSTYA